MLHGHGTRERQLRGPLQADGQPELVSIRVRRYLCCACDTVVTVAPREVVRRRLFSASAIGLALALWAVAKLPEEVVRQRVSPWGIVGYAAATGWKTLWRWAQAVREGRLFNRVRPAPEDWSLRQVAERAATTLSALAPPLPGRPLEVAAFLGATQAARG
jgi:hypothetical protein